MSIEASSSQLGIYYVLLNGHLKEKLSSRHPHDYGKYGEFS